MSWRRNGEMSKFFTYEERRKGKPGSILVPPLGQFHSGVDTKPGIQVPKAPRNFISPSKKVP